MYKNQQCIIIDGYTPFDHVKITDFHNKISIKKNDIMTEFYGFGLMVNSIKLDIFTENIETFQKWKQKLKTNCVQNEIQKSY